MPILYGWVREVVPESPADLAGLQPGDLLRTINGKPVRDLVDYQFYASEEELLLGVERNGRAIDVLLAKDTDDEAGIRFGEEPAPFIRQCANKCVFCFIKGLPERHQPARGLPLGMRESLYIKDDDYRYSFLFGNFITLTNLKEKDWQRLEEQRLSPLYVSVHTHQPRVATQDGGRPALRRDHRTDPAVGRAQHWLSHAARALPADQRWRRAGAQHRRSGSPASGRGVHLRSAGGAD